MDPQGPGLTTHVEPGQHPNHGSDVSSSLLLEIGEATVRVRVRPQYLPQRSDPMQPMHVFAYSVAIEYDAPQGSPSVQVVDRTWRIIDAHGTEEIVQGEGLVGQQPVLRPGERFEYSSYCPLRTKWGTMEGEFGLVVLDHEDQPGQRHLATVGRFYLVSR